MTKPSITKTRAGGTAATLDPLIQRVNTFTADNYWDLGKFLVDKVIPAALQQGIFGEQILKQMSGIPGFKFPFQMLKHCQRFYTYYPDVEKRSLPEMFYFELATRVEDSKKRDHYERLALRNKWTISDLHKKIREDEHARREDEKTRFGFDLTRDLENQDIREDSPARSWPMRCFTILSPGGSSSIPWPGVAQPATS
jgi:hypothetical protein